MKIGMFICKRTSANSARRRRFSVPQMILAFTRGDASGCCRTRSTELVMRLKGSLSDV